MDFASLLSDLGRETGLDLASAVQSGSCTIEFGSEKSHANMEVTFEATEYEGVAQSLLHMHVVIGTAPVLGADILFARLMQIHVLGLATAQGMFGYDAALRNILFFKSLVLPSLTPRQALALVEAFVNQAERWRGHLPALISSGASLTGSSSLIPDFLLTA